jgi:hypothetical protein
MQLQSKSPIQDSKLPSSNGLSRFLPDFGGIYCLMVFLTLTAAGGGPALLDGDTLWHIKAGEIMLQRGTILTTDIFSHTVHGQPWIAHEWLSEIIMALIHSWAGIPGVTVFYFLLVAMSFWFLFLLAEPYDNPWLAIFCISIALALAQMHILARPHIFTWFFGTLTLLLLTRGGRLVYFLPPITALWANLHGGFVLGLVLQGLFLLGYALERGLNTFFPSQWRFLIRERQREILVLLLSIAAVGLNPFGYKLLIFPFQVSAGIFSTAIEEWLGPNMQEDWPFRIFVLFIIFLLFLRGQEIRWTNRIFVLFFLDQAMVHRRHIALAGIFLTPFFLEILHPWFDQALARLRKGPEKPQVPLSRITAPVLTILAAVIVMAGGASASPSLKSAYQKLFPIPQKYSPAAIDYLKEHPPPGKMLNEDDLGDYLIYTLGPDFPVFIDGRLDMYGQKIIEDYIKMSQVGTDTNSLLRSYDIGWVIFPKADPLILYLREKKGWKEVYRDEQVSILVHNSEKRP